MGAELADGSDERPLVPLDAAILFAPVGALVPAALAAVRKGGQVVCGGIHLEGRRCSCPEARARALMIAFRPAAPPPQF